MGQWIDEGRKGVFLSILSTSPITGRAFTVPSAIRTSGAEDLLGWTDAEWDALRRK
jgi:hypothetical protein